MSRALRLLILLAAVCSTDLSGQAVWLPATNQASLSVEYLRPHAAPIGGEKWLGYSKPWLQGAIFLSGRLPVYRGVSLAADLPLAGAIGRDNACGGDVDCTGFHQRTVVGNPYLGADVPLGIDGLRWQTGMRVPVLGAGNLDRYQMIAAELGFWAGGKDRREAFLHDMFSAASQIAVAPRLDSHTRIDLRIGVMAIHENGASWPGQEWLTQLRGGAVLWHEHGPAEFGLGLSAVNQRRTPIAHRGTDFDFGGSAGLHVGRWLPMLQAQIPSDPPWGNRLRWWSAGLALQYETAR